MGLRRFLKGPVFFLLVIAGKKTYSTKKYTIFIKWDFMWKKIAK